MDAVPRQGAAGSPGRRMPVAVILNKQSGLLGAACTRSETGRNGRARGCPAGLEPHPFRLAASPASGNRPRHVERPPVVAERAVARRPGRS
jgi:hypothetical protein